MKTILIMSLMALFLCSCGVVPVTGRKQLRLVSDEEVLSLSNQSFTDYMKTAKLSTSKADIEEVQRVGARISRAVEEYLRNNNYADQIPDLKWQFVLVKDNTPNAFALPGGKVVVNEGILPYTRNDDGLAVVVGHEIAHAIARHGNERMSQQMLLQYGDVALGLVMQDKPESSRQLASSIYGLGSQVGVMLPYSRKQEFEADRMGLIFMAMAGYNYNEAPAFWERMSQNAGGNKPLEILSTHPSDANRVAYIRSLLPEVAKYKKYIY